MKFFKNSKLILVVILVIAFILRIWQVNTVPVSLFGDELDLGYQAYSILHTGADYYGNKWPLQFHSLAEYRTPLYLYSAVPSVALFGISPLGVRLPAIIFGVLGVWALYLLIKELTRREDIALIAAAVLTFSPWHLQYSRAGFEVTELLFFLIMGLCFFFKAIHGKGKYLWMSVVCFCLGPWIYSTAKLFIPILMIFLLILYQKEIFKLPKKYLVYTCIVGIIVGLPLAYSVIKTPQRFDYISVFSDPTIEPQIGTLRQRDAAMRGETGTGLNPTILDKLFENKIVYIGKEVVDHYAMALSSDFLFRQGDPDPRQSPTGMGEFYKIEAVSMLVGVVLFFSLYKERKTKLLIGFWILLGVLPSALTRDGGNHATRLILILPPLVFLVAYGITEGFKLFKGNLRRVAAAIYVIGFLFSAVMYFHNYYVHYPWDSEIWWHAGYQEAFADLKALDKNYQTVVISTANEPPWIFFAAYYEYSPSEWQKNFPIGNDVNLPGFGVVSHINKYYFGTPKDSGIYNIGKDLNKKILYLADAKESNVNFILEPDRVPKDLVLLKAIAYPSGEPAFYIFTGK